MQRCWMILLLVLLMAPRRAAAHCRGGDVWLFYFEGAVEVRRKDAAAFTRLSHRTALADGDELRLPPDSVVALAPCPQGDGSNSQPAVIRGDRAQPFVRYQVTTRPSQSGWADELWSLLSERRTQWRAQLTRSGLLVDLEPIDKPGFVDLVSPRRTRLLDPPHVAHFRLPRPGLVAKVIFLEEEAGSWRAIGRDESPRCQGRECSAAIPAGLMTRRGRRYGWQVQIEGNAPYPARAIPMDLLSLNDARPVRDALREVARLPAPQAALAQALVYGRHGCWDEALRALEAVPAQEATHKQLLQREAACATCRPWAALAPDGRTALCPCEDDGRI